MSSIPQGRRCNDTHSDTASLAWLSICKQTEKDHKNPSSGCTDRSRSVSGEGADNSKPPPSSGAAKTAEPGRSDQPKYTVDSATEILSKFGLDKDDLGELNAYSEDQITPENLKCILMEISINKKKRAAEKSSELLLSGLKSNLHKTPVKSNKVDCSDFGSSFAKKETGKASTDKSNCKSLVETHKPSGDQLQRCELKGKSRDLDSKTSRKCEISEQNKMVSPKHKPDGPKLCKPLPPKQPESTSKSSKSSKPEQKSFNSKESKTCIEETMAAGQNKKSPETKPEVRTELKHGQQGQDKPVMQTKFKGSSSKNEPSHAVISAKQKPGEPKPCKPVPPKQPESTSKSSKPGKAEQKSSNIKESKTQIKETTVAAQNKAELKHGQKGQDKSVMQTKFKGSSCKNKPSDATIRDCKGISPESFPHYCSICNKESRDVQAWCSHMKTANHREKFKTLYPDLFCEQQFSRIDAIWRRCQETGKHKSDSCSPRRRNTSRSRSRERRHRRDSSSRTPCRKNVSRSRSQERRHKRGSSSRSPRRRNASRSCSRSHDRRHKRSSSSRSPRRRNASRSRSLDHRHRRRSSSCSPRRRNASHSRSQERHQRRGSGSRSPRRRNASRSRSLDRRHRRGSSSRSPRRRNASRSRSHDRRHRRDSSSCSHSPYRQHRKSRSRSTSTSDCSSSEDRRDGCLSPSRSSYSYRHTLRSRSCSPRYEKSASYLLLDHLLPPGSTFSQGSPLSSSQQREGPPLLGTPPFSWDHLLPPGSNCSQVPPLMGPPPVSQDHLLPPGFTSSQGTPLFSSQQRGGPPLLGSTLLGTPPLSWDHSLPPGSNCSQVPLLMGPPPVSQDHLLPPGSNCSQGPPPSWNHSLPPGTTSSQGPPLMGPPPVSRDHLLSPGSNCSQGPPPSWDHSLPPGSTSSHGPPLMGPPPVSQDHLLPPGSTSSQGPPLSSFQQRGGPPLMGPPFLGPPPLSWDHLLPPGSTSSQGQPLCSSQERCRPPLLGPPPLLSPVTTSSLPCPPPLPLGISRHSILSVKEAQLYSLGMPSERQLSPKSSSKNPLSPSGSGEKQMSGETSVPQDESRVETLVKKLLQSSAVQSLSKQIDVESVVKTLTPVFLDEFNKLTSTPGSSEAPQTKSTASFPPNHKSSGPQKPPVTSTEQKTATEMKSQPSNKIEALKVKEKPKNETELKCPAITPGESKPASNKKPAPVICSDDLTIGERIEKCFDPKLLWPVESKDSILEPELLITNLPKYYDGCYTEDDVVALLQPFGFRNSSDIYVIPQKQLAVAFMPQVKGLRKALTHFSRGLFFKGSKLSLQACRAVTGWKPGKPTSLSLYKALMRCLKHNMTDNGERVICIHHISPSEARDLRTTLRKIGSVRNFLPLLNKVFVEFESKQDADRLGVWHSFLKRGRKHTVERLKMVLASSVALPPKLPAQALPDASDAVATARIPIANGVIKDCSNPPFWVTMSTPPYMFPTMSPWFDIPAFQTVKEVNDIKKALPQASQFSSVMLTGFPQSIRSQNVDAQLVLSYFTKGHSQSVNVLPLQRRAFVFFPCWDSCRSFLEGYLTHKPSPGKDFVLKVHLVLEDMQPGDTEETMYKNLMRWSNAHVSEPESLSQRLICVTFSDATLSIIQSVLMAVASLAPFVNYLVLAERVYIEMCDSSSVALVMDLLLFNRLSEEEKKKINDYDEKKKKDVWRKLGNAHLFKVKNVRLVQRQPPAGGAVPGLAEGAPDKTQPAGVEAAACEQQQAEAAEEEDVGTDSAEDQTENKSCTQQTQTPTDKLSKEEGELIDCVTDQKDELNEEEEEKPAEKPKTASKESETRGGSAAKDDETTSSDDVLATSVSENTAAGNSGGDDKQEEEPTTRRDNVLTSESRAKITESKTNGEETPAEKQKTADKESEMRGGSAAKEDETSSSEDVTAGGQNEEEEEKEASTKPEQEVGAETLRSADGSDQSSPVLDQSVNAAASCELEEMKQEVTSTRKRGRPRKKPRKTPVRKSVGGKPESSEENGEEEETKSLPGASLDSSSAVLGDVKTETDAEAAQVLDQSVNAAAAAELEETEQEVTSIRKGGRSRKTPVRKSVGGKPESPEENGEEEETKSLPGASLDSSSAVLGDVKTETDAEAAGDLEEMEKTEQEMTSTKKRGRPRKKPRKTPVRKSAGGKPESPEENGEEEETKSLSETDAEGLDRQNLDGCLEEKEEEDEGRSRADGEGLEEETVPSVLDQSVNAAASCELEETEETKQEVTSTRKRGRPRKKPRKTPVRKSVGGKPESSEENGEEETKSLPGASLDSSSAVLGDFKTETDAEAAEGPDKQNLDGHLEEEEEEEEEAACKKRRQSPCTVADFILPPFNPDVSFGEEFTARKLGYFCSLCSVFYVLKSNEEDTHCCSRNHYDNLLKHSQMKEEQPSHPPKRKTRNSR